MVGYRCRPVSKFDAANVSNMIQPSWIEGPLHGTLHWFLWVFNVVHDIVRCGRLSTLRDSGNWFTEPLAFLESEVDDSLLFVKETGDWGWTAYSPRLCYFSMGHLASVAWCSRLLEWNLELVRASPRTRAGFRFRRVNVNARMLWIPFSTLLVAHFFVMRATTVLLPIRWASRPPCRSEPLAAGRSHHHSQIPVRLPEYRQWPSCANAIPAERVIVIGWTPCASTPDFG